MRRPQIGKLGNQIAVWPYLVACHLPVCEDSQEEVRDVVGERPAIARKGCWARGVVAQKTEQIRQHVTAAYIETTTKYAIQMVEGELAKFATDGAEKAKLIPDEADIADESGRHVCSR